MFEFSNPDSFIVIALVALGTYSLRFGGLILASRLPKTGRIRRGMDALPGALLFSLVLPNIVGEGLWGIAAGALTALVALRTKNLLFAMVAGMAVILIQRQLF